MQCSEGRKTRRIQYRRLRKTTLEEDRRTKRDGALGSNGKNFPKKDGGIVVSNIASRLSKMRTKNSVTFSHMEVISDNKGNFGAFVEKKVGPRENRN